MKVDGCPLCETEGGLLIFKSDQLRVIQAIEMGFPAFYRVVWNAHLTEFSDLTPIERTTCMNVVVAVEQTLRQVLRPTKVNLATLGNVVAHLHWHVIARFEWDSHFPGSVWAAAQRQPDAHKLAQIALQCEQINQLLPEKLAAELSRKH